MKGSDAKRTASPLIPPARPKPLRRGEGPAFSPLRGEGDALDVLKSLDITRREGMTLKLERTLGVKYFRKCITHR
jgi:hypothetical protein